ncbi:MAG TPA: hypothetical protein VHL09_17230 [Dehalococcoidia bacterium]|nr:hypothetical protein [Dehalococcoidia bacterium]
MTIHLGDDRSPPPGWIALYNRLIPSTFWISTFYLRDPVGVWELSALVQAGREPTSEILINGWTLRPRYLRAADPDDLLAWRVVTATVPIGVLRGGPNEIVLRVGQHPPFRQQTGDTWDDLQFRGIEIYPSTAPDHEESD